MSLNNQPVSINKLIGSVALAIVIFVALIFGVIGAGKVFSRHQRVADANNHVKTSQIEANNQTKLNEIRIGQQAQLVKVAGQDAEIRKATALGIRSAQDQIAKTLTPLYVQFEMIQALQAIAKSGKNSTVVYVPSGANGIPMVSGLAGQPAVGMPDSK